MRVRSKSASSDIQSHFKVIEREEGGEEEEEGPIGIQNFIFLFTNRNFLKKTQIFFKYLKYSKISESTAHFECQAKSDSEELCLIK